MWLINNLGNIFLALAVFLACFIGVYMKKQKSQQTNKKSKKLFEKDGAFPSLNNMEKKKKNNIQDLFGVEDIKDGVIKLKNGGYRAILSISSPDFEILTADEQTAFEDILMQFGLSLTFPIQFFTTTVKVDTKEAANKINQVINSKDEFISNSLREVATELRNELISMETRENYVRKSFCILGVNNIQEYKRVLNEIKNKVETVTCGLKAGRMRITPLETEKILQVLYSSLHKNSNISISKLIEDGALELYSEGLGVVIYEESKEGMQTIVSQRTNKR